MHSFSIAPYSTVTGAVLVDDDNLPANTAARVHALLAEKRILGSVDHNPDRRPQDEVLFTLLCDADLRTVRAGKTGKPVTGKLIENLEADLQRELGHTVSLTQDIIDADYDDLEDFAEAGFETEIGPYDPSELEDGAESEVGSKEAGFEEAGFEEAGFDNWGEDHHPEDSPTDWPAEPPSRVLVFSKRGVSNGAIVSWFAKSSVDAGALSEWSVFRFLDHNYTSIPDAGEAEMPSIELTFAGTELDGWDTTGWAHLTVATPAAQGFTAHTLYFTAAAHRRPVLEAAELSDEAAKLQAVATNDHLLATSQANLLIADPTADVDAEALHAALAPEFEGETADRAVAVLAALGVPSELAIPAVRGEPLPAVQRFEHKRFWHTLLQIGELGHEGLRARASKPSLLGRFDDARRQNRVLDYCAAAAEAAVGAALISAGTRSRGGRKAFGLLGGLLVLSDAMFDLIIARRRHRKN